MDDGSWRNRKTLILGRTDMIGPPHSGRVRRLRRAGLSDARRGPLLHGARRATSCSTAIPGEWEAMPSYIEEPEAAACKWVSIREQNREQYGLPTVFSILIYTHPETGFPLAICDGSYHTVMRTGAAAAVSAKWMARKDSQGARDRRRGPYGRGHARHLQRPSSTGRGTRLEPHAESTLDRFRRPSSSPNTRLRAQGLAPTSTRSCAAPTSSSR